MLRLGIHFSMRASSVWGLCVFPQLRETHGRQADLQMHVRFEQQLCRSRELRHATTSILITADFELTRPAYIPIPLDPPLPI